MTIAVDILAYKKGRSAITDQGVYKLTQHVHISPLSSTINCFSLRDFISAYSKDK